MQRLIVLFLSVISGIWCQRKAFVDPQSDCQIRCLNGGFCAYLVDNPSQHTCLCLQDLFYGDHCQHSVHNTAAVPLIPDVEEPTSSVIDGNDFEHKPDEDYRNLNIYGDEYSEDEKVKLDLDDFHVEKTEANRHETEVKRLQGIKGYEGFESDIMSPGRSEESVGRYEDETGIRVYNMSLHEGNIDMHEHDDGMGASNNFRDDNEEIRQSEQSFIANERIGLKDMKDTEGDQYSIEDSEADYGDWMLSKRKRLETNGAQLNSQMLYRFILLLFPLLRLNMM